MNNYKGFFKVNENNGGVNVCTFFNPETKEEFSKIVWDIDNDRLLEDDEIQILRYLTADGRMKQRQSPDATMKMAKRSGSKQTIVNM